MAQSESNLVELKSKLNNEKIAERFQQMLGKKSSGFITSITNIVQNNTLLQKADTNSIILAASQAAALDLPITPALGLAAIVPYNDTINHTCAAQFQVMKNGWVELALRSGQFEYLVAEQVYDGELVYHNRFTDEYQFDENKKRSDKIIGYMASLKLVSGYHKTIYWTVEQCKQHGLRYSQTFKKGKGLWATDFNSMCIKTVLKHLLVKYAPKSIENLVTAINADQAVFSGDIDNPKVSYVDNVTKNDVNTKETSEFIDAQEVKEVQNEEKKSPQTYMQATKPQDEF